ncbi:hypothetical protein [Streptomyces sp. SAS_272]|uniref:hypothetical protein n=1 Tax=Streptomyces sp. SAS_272 TaxID=3412747 RepID=UPI00403D08EF
MRVRDRSGRVLRCTRTVRLLACLGDNGNPGADQRRCLDAMRKATQPAPSPLSLSPRSLAAVPHVEEPADLVVGGL